MDPERRHWSGAQDDARGMETVRTAGIVLATGSSGAPAATYQPGTESSFGVLAWQSDGPIAVPVTLTIGGQMPFAVVGGIDWVPAYGASGEACLLAEYGAGSASSRVKLDVVSGSVAFPPVTFFRLSVLVRPTAVMALYPALTMQAVLTQGAAADTEARYTWYGVPNGTYQLPPQAVVVGTNTPGTMTMLPSGIVVDHRWDASPQVMTPPWSPVDVTFAASVQYVKSALYAGQASFYAVSST